MALRLHLGCGPKRWPGFVNVDIAEGDVLADLTKPLPFEGVDEIHAIHVIEHFWRWEVETILRQWCAVLRPGGKIVLELPDLTKILGHMGSGNPTLTLHGLYGDPKYKNPFMCHKWAYTAQEMKQVMEAAGFSDIRVEPPIFHMAARDMRLIGGKPSCS